VTPELRERAEQVLSYTFKNPNLLKEALTHASIADNRLNSNERMEFLGDAVLDLIVCEALYSKFPQYQEGDLTKIKSAVVSRRTCAEVANETGLTDLLIIGKGISSRNSMPSSLAAAVYESIVAAVYLDGGFEVVKQYVLRTMTPKIESIAHLVVPVISAQFMSASSKKYRAEKLWPAFYSVGGHRLLLTRRGQRSVLAAAAGGSPRVADPSARVSPG